MLLKTKGLVLFERRQSEQDSLLTILTPENGLILARANGARRIKSKLAAATEFLSYSDFTLFLRKEIATVDTAEAQHLFYGIRTVPEKLALASYFAALTRDLITGTQNTGVFLRLLLNALFFMERDQRSLPLLKAVFELQCMTHSGYRPDLYGCKICGAQNPEALFFLPESGQLLCTDCGGKSSGGRVRLNPALAAALQSATAPLLETAFSFRLGEENTRQLSALAERFCLARLEYRPKTLTYYHTLCGMLPPLPDLAEQHGKADPMEKAKENYDGTK